MYVCTSNVCTYGLTRQGTLTARQRHVVIGSALGNPGQLMVLVSTIAEVPGHIMPAILEESSFIWRTYCSTSDRLIRFRQAAWQAVEPELFGCICVARNAYQTAVVCNSLVCNDSTDFSVTTDSTCQIRTRRIKCISRPFSLVFMFDNDRVTSWVTGCGSRCTSSLCFAPWYFVCSCLILLRYKYQLVAARCDYYLSSAICGKVFTSRLRVARPSFPDG